MSTLESDGIITIYDIETAEVVARYEGMEIHEELTRLRRLPRLDETLPPRATALWGREAQYLVAVEECAELVKAVTKFLNRGVPHIDVVTEAADVMLLVYQIYQMWPIAFSSALEQSQDELRHKLESMGG